MKTGYQPSTINHQPSTINHQPSTLMPQDTDINQVQAPILDAPPEIRQIIERILQLEKDKLYLKSPRNINDDILKIIKEEIQ